MHCEELIRALVKRAEAICGRLIAKMYRDHQELNVRYLRDAFILLGRNVKESDCHLMEAAGESPDISDPKLWVCKFG